MTNQTEQGAAQPRITVELLHRVYRNTPEWAPYLRARFAEPGAKSFELDGHRWAYRCSSFDDAGDYDLLWRPDANPTSEGCTSVPAGYALVPLEPTEEMLAAAHEGDRQYTLRTFGDVMTVMQGPYDHWRAMVAAATSKEKS